MYNLNIKIMSNSHFFPNLTLSNVGGKSNSAYLMGKIVRTEKVRIEWFKKLCVPVVECARRTARTIAKNCHNTFPFWDNF